MSARTDAEAIIGGLSYTSKMPGPSYSTSAFDCQTGGKLREVAGSVCSKCYAMKGRYPMPNVRDAHTRRLDTIHAALADLDKRAAWVAAFKLLLNGVPHFRWHDSGDLQSRAHFELVADVARATPKTMHWLPTKEARFIGKAPANLVVRLSSPMIDGAPVKGYANTSTVHKAIDSPAVSKGTHICPAPKRKNTCGSCRACWNPRVANMSYHQH
jgi:hypothetical protein